MQQQAASAPTVAPAIMVTVLEPCASGGVSTSCAEDPMDPLLMLPPPTLVRSGGGAGGGGGAKGVPPLTVGRAVIVYPTKRESKSSGVESSFLRAVETVPRERGWKMRTSTRSTGTTEGVADSDTEDAEDSDTEDAGTEDADTAAAAEDSDPDANTDADTEFGAAEPRAPNSSRDRPGRSAASAGSCAAAAIVPAAIVPAAAPASATTADSGVAAVSTD